MQVTVKITDEEKKEILENYLRSLYNFGKDWELSENYISLGEFVFEKKEEIENDK